MGCLSEVSSEWPQMVTWPRVQSPPRWAQLSLPVQRPSVWGFTVRRVTDVTAGTRGGGREARRKGQATCPPPPNPIGPPATYLPLDGGGHFVALLHDASEHWVAQAWERDGNGQGAGAGGHRTTLRKTTGDRGLSHRHTNSEEKKKCNRAKRIR